jgi:hypothetical protein
MYLIVKKKPVGTQDIRTLTRILKDSVFKMDTNRRQCCDNGHMFNRINTLFGAHTPTQ